MIPSYDLKRTPRRLETHSIIFRPPGVTFWYAQNKGQESDNQTAFNDVAYGFRLTDNWDGIASDGDVLELVGIVYSTGADSVFGKTANELTALVIPPSPAPSEFISYDLDLLDNTTDTNQYNTTMTYPDAYAGGFIMKDPGDDIGYMGRMGKSQFTSESATMLQRYSSGDSYIYAKASNAGFTGADVLSTSNYSNSYISAYTSGGILYQTSTNVYWYAQIPTKESDNQTAFNDVAFGFKLTDTDADGLASAGDVLELVGIVYSTGTDSVFGKTADELTAMLEEAVTAAGTPYICLDSYGLVTNGYEDADLSDTDGDGLATYQEYIADTAPTNADSALRITGVHSEGGNIRIDWQGGTKATQYLECIASLSTTNSWTTIYTNTPVTPGSNSYQIAGETNKTLFYRIRVERVPE